MQDIQQVQTQKRYGKKEASPDHPLVEVAEAKLLLRMSHSAFYKYKNSGEIPTINIGHRVYVPRSFIFDILNGKAQLSYKPRAKSEGGAK